ncbi:MAG: tyrosine-type recombinase/integrase [Gaiellaceae bacterium]
MTPRKRQTPGIEIRHSRYCPSRSGGKCDAASKRQDACKPTYLPWVYSPREKKKVRPTHGFPTEAAAKSWRVDALSAQSKGTLRTPTRLTLELAAEAWADGARAGEIHARGQRPYKPSVVRSYETTLRRHVVPVLGHHRLSDLTTPDLQKFINRLIAAGMNSSTIRNCVNPLRAIYRHAVAVGDVGVNPALGLQLPSVDGTRERVATVAEAEALLASVPGDHRAVWSTAFFAGLRRGELRALRCRHVDLANGLISVEAGWDDIEGEIAPKSKKGTRKVPIPARLKKDLAEQMARTGRRGDDLIFGATATRPFTSSYVRLSAQKAWAAVFTCGCAIDEENEGKTCREHGAGRHEPIGLHECRHTFVTLMFNAGVRLEEIGDFVGHSSTYMVDRYRHLLPTSAVDSAAKLDAFLAGRN